MYKFLLILHVIVAASVIGVILIQRGRSGGLVEALGGVESIFGTKTNSFFVKATVVLAVLFFITSISVAYVSRQKGRSLIDKHKGASRRVSSQLDTSVPAVAPAVEKETATEAEMSHPNDSE